MTDKALFVTIPVSNQEGLASSGFLRLCISSERISSVSLETGFCHRGIEKLAETKTFYQLPYLLSRICANSSVAHSLVSARAIESLASSEISSAAKYIRVLFLEIERIIGHLEKLKRIYNNCGSVDMFLSVKKLLRDLRLQLQRISGNSYHADFIVPGGVSKLISREEFVEIKNVIEEIYSVFTDKKNKPIINNRIEKKLRGLAFLDKALCENNSASGILARSAGIAVDARKEKNLYKSLGFQISVGDICDAYGRFKIILNEIVNSCFMVGVCMDKIILETGPATVTLGSLEEIDGMGSCESVEGKLSHYVRYRGGNTVYSYRVSTAAEKNMDLYLKALVGVKFSDINIALSSLDVCFNCLEK